MLIDYFVCSNWIYDVIMYIWVNFGIDLIVDKFVDVVRMSKW